MRVGGNDPECHDADIRPRSDVCIKALCLQGREASSVLILADLL